MKIGVISDTHGFLDPRVPPLLYGVDLILHAGDIGTAEVIQGLESIAPVTAVRGNNDRSGQTANFEEELLLELSGRRLFLTHQVQLPKRKGNPPPDRFLGQALDVVVFGHSYIAHQEWRNGILFFNPGAAGKRRFRVVPSLGLLELTAREIKPTVIPL